MKKINKNKLKEVVHKALSEAAAEGKFQKYAKGTVNSMIKLISTAGGNKNTPPYSNKPAKAGKSGPPIQESVKKNSVSFSGILKIDLDPKLISELEPLQGMLPEEAKRISPDHFHITLIHQDVLSQFRKRLKSMTFPPIDFPIILDSDVYERTSPGKKSWAVKVVNQGDLREYVKDILEILGSYNTDPEPERRFHVSLANLTGNPHDSVR
jgi:hypothetical protein